MSSLVLVEGRHFAWPPPQSLGGLHADLARGKLHTALLVLYSSLPDDMQILVVVGMLVVTLPTVDFTGFRLLRCEALRRTIAAAQGLTITA